MDGKLGDRLPHPPPLCSSIVAIAISRKKKNSDIIEWAIDKFGSDDNVKFMLLHVRPRITSVPTPMGAAIPILEVREDVASAYRQEIEWQTNQMLLPYKKFCEKRKVLVDAVVVEYDDVPAAISNQITRQFIGRLVVGVSPRGYFSRKIDMCSIIAASAPTFCTVYAVSKGKLSSIRPSLDSKGNAAIKEISETSSVSVTGSRSLSISIPAKIPILELPAANDDVSGQTSSDCVEEDSRTLASIEAEESRDTMSLNRSKSETTIGWISRLRDLEEVNDDEIEMRKIVSRDSRRHGSNLSDDLSQGNLKFEIDQLRTELRHVQDMYAISQTENIKRRHFEDKKIVDEDDELIITVKEEKSKQLVEEATQETAVAAENRGRDGSAFQFQRFTWEEIVEATSGFCDDLKIGTGSYGTVYRCTLHHTIAAVKVLHCAENMMNRQFQLELKILSRTCHRHLVLLLGACLERGCLVYEFMENGSLQDRLLQHNNTPPIPWFERFRIAHEVASALVFLHRSTPIPIIHRGLKPANILLDRNFVSKLVDIGLCATSNRSTTDLSRSDLCYSDPEYHRTGLISPKSDVYAFGMVILQLLTAKSVAGIAMAVERSIRNDVEFMKILDRKAGDWPIKETRELAALGLCCTELRTRDRPNLKDQILPALERFRKVGEEAKNSISDCLFAPPAHFICPLLKDVMSNPCVASDGYTYDRRAIEEWLVEHDTSPMTNMPLPDKSLIPNHPLLIAITEWKSEER